MTVVWLSLWRGLQVGRAPRIPFSELVAMTAEKHGVSAADICGPSAKRPFVRARQEVCWLARRHTALSLTAIGARLNRHHTTILAAIRRHEASMSLEAAA